VCFYYGLKEYFVPWCKLWPNVREMRGFRSSFLLFLGESIRKELKILLLKNLTTLKQLLQTELLKMLTEELCILGDFRVPPRVEGTYRPCGTRRVIWDPWWLLSIYICGEGVEKKGEYTRHRNCVFLNTVDNHSSSLIFHSVKDIANTLCLWIEIC